MTAGDILKQYWGYTQFRPGQTDIIQQIAAGRDTLALLPTGGGKSICFQVPGLMRGGLTLVVSPLIALMKDQVEGLMKHGIPAASLHSGHSKGEMDLKLQNALKGMYRFLYISPERLATDNFRGYLPNLNIRLLVVDEAHCISQWGYDFRPPYLQIAECREWLPGVPLVAFTASAPPRVASDIISRLMLREPFLYRGDFQRPNLHFWCVETENKTGYITRALLRSKGAAIVFTDTRRDAEELSRYLQEKGVSAEFYHAGLPAAERSRRQEQWMQNHVRVMVCTNAFGMGVDKPDVRVVIHTMPPPSPEDYYQEAGRAGRDGQDSWCILLYRKKDLEELENRIRQMFPGREDLERVYTGLMNYLGIPAGGGENRQFEMDLYQFAETYQLPNGLVYHGLKCLELLEMLQLTEGVLAPSRLHITADYSSVYDFKVRYARFQPIIDMLLRSYGGVFDSYIKISEQVLARRLHTTQAALIADLQALHKTGILEYLPASDAPRITIIEPRSPYPKFNLRQLEPLKKSKLDGVKKMASYIHKSHCRSAFWIEHYTSTPGAECGLCDLCTRRKKEALKGPTFDQWRELIREWLLVKAMTRTEILGKMDTDHATEGREVLRWLMDNRYVLIDANQQLYWGRE
ncbi:MAG: ATP-dependent DNA helicase RecQ [Bacteroidetes bacterium]|nr:ATP-dependent DNA helicase RecQ [Bacteroidota bacterium]